MAGPVCHPHSSACRRVSAQPAAAPYPAVQAAAAQQHHCTAAYERRIEARCVGMWDLKCTVMWKGFEYVDVREG